MQGVFHVELKYTSRGPRLIEVNCRMGGGPVRNTNLLVWGVDLVEEHLLTCAGIPSRPPVAVRPLMYIAEYSINAQKSGKIQHVDFLKVCSGWCLSCCYGCWQLLLLLSCHVLLLWLHVTSLQAYVMCSIHTKLFMQTCTCVLVLPSVKFSTPCG